MGSRVAPLLIIVALCLVFEHVSSAEAVESPWVSKALMPTPRSSFGVAVVNGKIYAIGGAYGSTKNEMYDPATNTWTTKASMPTPKMSFGIAVFKGKIYVFGGHYDFNMSSGKYMLSPSTEVYDPAMDAWETKPPMPTPRTMLRASVVNDRIYLIGGVSNRSTALNEVYDPATDAWVTKAPALADIYGYGSAVVDNKIFIVGGSASIIGGSGLTQIYNPAFDSWSKGAPIPSPNLVDAAATSGVKAPKRIYALGGRWTGSLNRIYDVENNSWSFGTPMPTPRAGLGVAVVDDVLYAIGGGDDVADSGPTGANEQYTPWLETALEPSSPSIPSQEPSVPSFPEVSIISPSNTSYSAVGDPYASVPLILEANTSLSWVGYSLDGGGNVTASNGTLVTIPIGSRSLTVYANDTSGNWAVPQIVYFTVVRDEGMLLDSFPWLPVAAGLVVVIAMVSSGLLLYRRKRRREAART